MGFQFFMRCVLLVSIISGCHGNNKVDCIANTGGSCMTEDCYAWRGPTTCNNMRCFCTSGCAGADEVCTTEPYVRVGNGTKYKIRNARWPEYHIDVDVTGRVDVEKRNTDEKDNEFVLLKPGYAGGQSPLSEPLFLITSHRWPESVISIQQSSDENTQYESVCMNVDGGLGGLGPDPSMRKLGLRMNLAPIPSSEPGRVLVMFSSYQFPDQFMFVPQSAYQVAVNRNDPGAGGYWYFEPQLPNDIKALLRPYVGPRCSSFCGEVSKAHIRQTILYALSLVFTISWMGI